MIRTIVFLFVAAVATFPARGAEFKVNGRTFQLPDGFTIERVAGPPLVDRPIVADFDEWGRLYVAESSGSNDKVQKQLAEKPHRIVRLEDTDGDGKFDRRTIFADRMMLPEGAMWRGGSLYVSAPPSIWKLTDTNGDGVADERSEWFQGKTLTGCANDLHGPYLGPDGWIYWCKGAFARQTYERSGKPPFSTRAAHIFRARSDGSGVEPVMTGGMDNPVDVIFMPNGERIFSTTFLQHPGGGRRDGFIHAIYAGIYGKVHDVIDEHPQTGPEVMPVMSHLGPAAPCGLTRYESVVFGADYRDNLFACQFNLRKVSRHVLTPIGSTYQSQDLDFLVSPDFDFHPTDVQEDADGSLIVVDTGGWYKLCCPTSQLEKPDVLGAIYRIRRSGTKPVNDPRGLGLKWEGVTLDDIAARLGDARPAVRRRAMDSLAGAGEKAISALAAVTRTEPVGSAVDPRPHALWTLTRIGGVEAKAIIRNALTQDSATVRAVALHSIGLNRDRDAVLSIQALLKSPSAFERRQAAEALGRIGDKSSVGAILNAAASPVDRGLEHALVYALIEIQDPSATSEGLKWREPSVRRVALIALDQMTGGGVAPDVVAADLSANDPATKETAAWIVGRHPEWGGTLASMLGERMRSSALSNADSAELVTQLARFAKSTAVQEVLGRALHDPLAVTRQRALKAMAGSGLKEAPRSWIDGLIALLTTDDSLLLDQAVSTTRALQIKGKQAGELAARLLEVSARTTLPVPLRIEALAAITGGLSRVSPATFAMLRDALQPDRPVNTRLLAAEVVASAKLANDQLVELTETLAKAGPMEIDRLLAAYETSSDEAVGVRLIAALKRSVALSSLRTDMILPRISQYGPEVHRQAETLHATLNRDATEQRARLDALMTTLSSGEIRRGQAVFNGTKGACLTCHALGYVGGNVGPDLSKIGQIRGDRDLLEAIVYPSASFVQSFAPVLIATKNGKSINGLLRKETSDEVILTTGSDQETRIARDDIEEIRPGTVSLMPAGLDQQLSPQDLADLIAFLKSRK